MHPNERLIRAFYQAFADRDAAAMGACYAPEAHFSDPAFGDLTGAEARAMWAMLTGRARELKVRVVRAEADERRGSARWEADYIFATTGRQVHNVIDARFEFAGGLITEHHDNFSFYRWARMAFGPLGWLVGWLPPFHAKVRKTAKSGLKAFMAR